MALAGLELTNTSFETTMILSSQAVRCYKVKGVNIILYTYTGHEAIIKKANKQRQTLKRQKNNLKEVKPG